MSPLGSHVVHFYAVILFVVNCVVCSQAFSIRELVKGSAKRGSDKGTVCPPWQPFECPSGDCIPFKYICDGSPDTIRMQNDESDSIVTCRYIFIDDGNPYCSDGYDEFEKLCIAAVRPPVEETSSFFLALLNAHGKDFFVPLFGDRAKDSLNEMGGIDRVSVAISESPTIEDFGTDLKLTEQEVEKMRETLDAIVLGLPSSLNDNESADFRFFVQKLKETHFF